MPLVVAKRPFRQGTLIAATTITASMRAGPTGPNRPRAMSRPLVNRRRGVVRQAGSLRSPR